MRAIGELYIPTAPEIGERLTIVCGPPRAGKNTYVEENRAPDDIIVDLDLIMARKGDGMSIREAYRRRDVMLRWVKTHGARAWLIIGAPLIEQRQAMREGLKPGRIVVIETPLSLCMERAQDDNRELDSAIERWWTQYARDIRDEWV